MARYCSSVELPNGKTATLMMVQNVKGNYISQATFDSLRDSSCIHVSENGIFVEFYKKLKTELYTDGAWVHVHPSKKHFIHVGHNWLMERQALLDPERSCCSLLHPHFEGKEYVFKVHYYPPPTKTTSLPISNPAPSSEAAENGPKKICYKADPELVEEYYRELEEEAETELAELRKSVKDVPEAAAEIEEASVEIVLKEAAEIQEALVGDAPIKIEETKAEESKPEELPICKVPELVAPIVHLAPPCVGSFDAVWIDFLSATQVVYVVRFVATTAVRSTWSVRKPAMKILPHFKTRGRVFSNLGRMMGIGIHEDRHKFGRALFPARSDKTKRPSTTTGPGAPREPRTLHCG